jgi:hypothetical protein
MLATKLNEVAEQQNKRNMSITFCTSRLCAVIHLRFVPSEIIQPQAADCDIRRTRARAHAHTHTERVHDRHINRVNYGWQIQMLCKCQSLIKEMCFKSTGQRKIVIKFFPYIPPQLLDINNPNKDCSQIECKEGSYIYIYYRPIH